MSLSQSYRVAYMGLDPGTQGAIAVLFDDTRWVRLFLLRSTTLQDVWKFLSDFRLDTGAVKVYAVLEQVGGYMRRNEEKGTGGVQPGSSMFNFGANAGALEMGLVAMGLYEDSTYRKVRPDYWQRKLGVEPRRRGEPKNAHKNRLKEVAQELFPHVKVTLQTADALLLAEYCRRQQEGTL
jgi:hypothetical protein